jgi:hypothetical protein
MYVYCNVTRFSACVPGKDVQRLHSAYKKQQQQQQQQQQQPGKRKTAAAGEEAEALAKQPASGGTPTLGCEQQ